MSQNLNTKIDFRYQEALPFDWRGFAKVNFFDTYYLIDTLGNEYKLATDISQLDSTITALDLSHKNLDTLPAIIAKNKQLKVLLLNHNYLIKLSSNFGQLENLTTLNLHANYLDSLTNDFGDLQKLIKLDLTSNRIRELPNSFSNLFNLKELYLHQNHIKSLPSNFGNLKNIINLDLSKNSLKYLPDDIQNLRNLKLLYLRTNNLTLLPNTFPNLKNLTNLDLDNNKLITIPNGFENLENLKILSFNCLDQTLANYIKINYISKKILKCTIFFIDNHHEWKAKTDNQMEAIKLTFEMDSLMLIENQSIATHQEIIKIMLQINQLDNKNSRGDLYSIYQKYSNLMYMQFYEKKYREAEISAKEALRLGEEYQTARFLNAWIPHLLLFQGKYQEAEAEYFKWKDKPFDKEGSYKDVFLLDFRTFEKKGIIPSAHQAEVARIKKLLSE